MTQISSKYKNTTFSLYIFHFFTSCDGKVCLSATEIQLYVNLKIEFNNKLYISLFTLSLRQNYPSFQKHRQSELINFYN